MGIFGNIFGREREQKTTRVLTSADLEALLAGRTTSAGVGITPAAAMQYVTVWACVRLLAESLAQLPINVFQKKATGARQAVSQAPIADILRHHPNDWQTGFEYFEYLMTCLCLQGNCYCYQPRSTKGELLELLPLLPGQVKPKLNGWELQYEVRRDGGVETLPAEKIHHVRGLSMDRFTGVSPITHNRETIGLAIAAEKHGGRMFKNGARPSGILSFVASLADNAFDAIRESWQKNYGGDNQGGVAVLDNGAKFEPVSMSNEDAQYLEVRGFQRAEICSIYRVPPHMIGDLTKSSFNNITQQSLEFVKFTILPWCRRIESAICRDLLTRKEREAGLYVEFNMAGLERADMEQRMRSYNTGIMSGIYSPNECREKENMNPRPGGDVYLVPLNMADSSSDGAVKPRSIEEGTPAKQARQKDAVLTKGAARREQLRSQYARTYHNAAVGLVLHETAAIRELIKSAATPQELASLLEGLYLELPAEISRRFTAISRRYAVAVRKAALAEIDSDHRIEPDALAAYVEQLVTAMATRYVRSSSGQLTGLINGASEEQLAELLEERLAEWEERRPAKVGERESVQQESAVSRWVWTAAGVTQLQWTRRGSKSCPFCTDLDGKIVGIEAPFIEQGNYQPPGYEDSPWKVRGPKMHAPLHQGCQCIITPVTG